MLDLTELEAEVGRGLPARTLGDILALLDVPQATLASTLSIPERTLHRRLKGSGRLGVPESERVARLTRLYYLAARALGSPARARGWFLSRPKALDGRTPLELARTEPGARLVEQLLGRIEHGVFS